MNLHWIGRGVVERNFPFGRDHAHRTQAGRFLSQLCPDLAHEGDNGGFAFGAGDGGYGFRLGAIELRRLAPQAQTRILVTDEDHAQRLGVVSQFGPSQHGARALGDSVFKKTRAIGLAPGDGREQKSLLNLAAVAGQAPDVEAAQILCRHHGVLSFLPATFVDEWGAIMNFHPPEWPAVLEWGRPEEARCARSPGLPRARRFDRPVRSRRWP